MQQNERKSSRTRSPREKSPCGRMSRWSCKDYFKGTCNNSFCEKWHPPECLFYKTKSGCRFGEKCSYAHRQVDEQPTKRSKKNDDKSAVAILKKGDWQERGSGSAAEESEDTLNSFTSPTGYEPKLLTFGELNDSSVPFSFMIPSTDQEVDDVTLGEMLTAAHRGQVDYCVQGGMSVSQSVVVCNVRWIRAT